jgi:hypothetical protein
VGLTGGRRDCHGAEPRGLQEGGVTVGTGVAGFKNIFSLHFCAANNFPELELGTDSRSWKAGIWKLRGIATAFVRSEAPRDCELRKPNYQNVRERNNGKKVVVRNGWV